MRKIDIRSLEVAFEKIILKLKGENIIEIPFHNDLYRLIPTDQWEVYKEKIAKIEIGSLYDDVENIEKLRFNNERPCTYVDFDRVASILRMISEQLNSPTDTDMHG